MGSCRQVRCAFVVIKFKIDEEEYFLLRRDKDWNDLNLVGGHQESQDRGNFARTAKRELFEELSAWKGKAKAELTPITEQLYYGPVWSESANCESLYQLVFFAAHLDAEPETVVKVFGGGSKNFLVDYESLKLGIERKDVSSLLCLLEAEAPGGLEGIPVSMERDLGGVLGKDVQHRRFQRQLTFWSKEGER